jgi:hypothetical protein
MTEPYSRISDENFFKEIRKVLAIDFQEKLSDPDFARILPKPEYIINDVLNGIPVPHKTYLDDVLHHVAENFNLTPQETQELRHKIFIL